MGKPLFLKLTHWQVNFTLGYHKKKICMLISLANKLIKNTTASIWHENIYFFLTKLEGRTIDPTWRSR